MVLIYCLGTNNKQNDLAQKRYQSAITSLKIPLTILNKAYVIKWSFG